MATTYARKDYPPIPEIRTIGVLGAGQMGSGIAEVAASAGYEVRLVDVAAPQLEMALARIDRVQKLFGPPVLDIFTHGLFTDDRLLRAYQAYQEGTS